MSIPLETIRDVKTFVEMEIQAGRRHAALDPAVVEAFLASVPAPARAPAPSPSPSSQSAMSSPHPAAARTPQPSSPVPAPKAGSSIEARAATAASLDEIAAAIRTCSECHLAATRTKAVPGVGNGVSPDILFVGEAPGADEDLKGEPFVGRAGQLLTKMIAAMGYTRDQVFIANILKCRPPQNRTPTPDEMRVCIPYLRRQIALVKPRTIVALGATAYKGLSGEDEASISNVRGVWHSFDGIPLMPTFHPAYLLRCPTAKRAAWEDLQKVLVRLGKPIPSHG